MRVVEIPAVGPINLGMQGESLATQVRFTIPDDCTDFDLSVYAVPSGGSAYPVIGCSIEGGVAVWNVLASDTMIAGLGEVQFRFSKDGAIVKSIVFPTVVYASIDVDPGPVPEPYDTWLATLQELAQTTIDNAKIVAEAVAELHEITATATTLDAGAEATADYSDGLLTFGIPEGRQGERGHEGPQGIPGKDGKTIYASDDGLGTVIMHYKEDE